MRLPALAFLLSTTLLAACDNARVHQLYNGADDQAVSLQANDTVIVTHVDATEQDTAFIGQKHTYRLAPGKHTLVVEYAAFFQIDAERHEKVVSPPIKVTFEAEPGKSYVFSHPEQKTLDAAQAFAKSPTLAVLLLPDMAPVKASFEQSLPTRFLPAVRFENTESYGFASEKPAAAVLESLKAQWQQATPEQRDNFLKWVDKQ